MLDTLHIFLWLLLLFIYLNCFLSKFPVLEMLAIEMSFGVHIRNQDPATQKEVSIIHRSVLLENWSNFNDDLFVLI